MDLLVVIKGQSKDITFVQLKKVKKVSSTVSCPYHPHSPILHNKKAKGTGKIYLPLRINFYIDDNDDDSDGIER